MKISIITVCFNAKDSIEGTFLSIINQTHKDVEYIVIDGASTDGTVAIINKYKNYINHFISEPDEGIYNAMNKGISLATGDFILFLNANDALYNNHVLEIVAKTLNENPEIKVLFGDTSNISEDKKTSRIKTYDKFTNIFDFINENICHQSIFYSKSLFEKYGKYSKKYKIYADWDFNLKCLVKEKLPVIYIPIIISKFQLGGLSSNRLFEHIWKKEWKNLLKEYYNEFKVLIEINHFLKKNYEALYWLIMNKPTIRKKINNFVSQEKFQLDIIKL